MFFILEDPNDIHWPAQPNYLHRSTSKQTALLQFSIWVNNKMSVIICGKMSYESESHLNAF